MIEYIMLFINIVLIVFIMKWSKFRKIKNYLEELFWINKFKGNGFLHKSLRVYGICIIFMYTLMIGSSIYAWLITFNSWCLVAALILGIVMPLMFRLVIYMNGYTK